MKRLALVAVIVAAAACSKSDQTQMADTTTPVSRGDNGTPKGPRQNVAENTRLPYGVVNW